MTSIFHVILVEKQLIKHDILSPCLTFNFRHMSQINVIPVGVERSNFIKKRCICIQREQRNPKLSSMAGFLGTDKLTKQRFRLQLSLSPMHWYRCGLKQVSFPQVLRERSEIDRLSNKQNKNKRLTSKI